MRRATLLSFALTVAACQANDVIVEAHLAVSSHAQLSETLRVLIDVDNKEAVGEGNAADAQGDAIVVSLSLAPGEHVFQVRVESWSYPGVTLLQSVSKTVNITAGASVAFDPADFDVDEFDDDNNGLSNWEEFLRGCNPGASTDCEWQSVSAGREHTCALQTDGDLYCFGANNSDQLGYEGTDSTSPHLVPLAYKWLQVAAGGQHTCAIEAAENKVYCWGDGSYGQLGDGTIDGHSTPQLIDLGAVEISVGGYTSCAIDLQGALWCWGVVLGDRTEPRPDPPEHDIIPTQMGTETGWTDIAVGDAHACGVWAGVLWCWGTNFDGQVGTNDGFGADVPVIFPSEVVHTEGRAWVSVAVGATNTCAVDAASHLWCWGSDSDGAFGTGFSGEGANNPHQVGNQPGWQSVSVGDGHVCGVHDLSLKCWGLNKQGRTGQGDAGIIVGANVLPSNGAVWSVVSASASHTCGVKNGELHCWGAHGWGKTGLGLTGLAVDPKAVTHPTGADWLQVTAGDNHTCAIDDNGYLYCWGDNSYGALNASTIDSDGPVQVSPGSTWSQVACGNGFTCALDTQSPKQLSCWGANGSGQAGGINDPQLSFNNVTVPAGSAWLHITAGARHMCAIVHDTAAASDPMYCWGDNLQNAIGQGDSAETHYTVPTLIPGVASWSSVSAGLGFTCGISDAGERYCWGNNDLGQLGSGDTDPHSSPLLMTGTWSAMMGAGEAHACGLNAPDLFCWGYAGNGQVGNGTTSEVPVSTPAAVSGTSWSQVVAGSGHTCATNTSDQISCWGDNGYGQLGDGDDARNVPGSFLGGFWTALTAGAYHTCAINDANELYCWGSNEVGQLGTGDAWAATPRRVNLQ